MCSWDKGTVRFSCGVLFPTDVSVRRDQMSNEKRSKIKMSEGMRRVLSQGDYNHPPRPYELGVEDCSGEGFEIGSGSSNQGSACYNELRMESDYRVMLVEGLDGVYSCDGVELVEMVPEYGLLGLGMGEDGLRAAYMSFLDHEGLKPYKKLPTLRFELTMSVGVIVKFVCVPYLKVDGVVFRKVHF